MNEHKLELDVSRGKIDVFLDGKPIGKIEGKIASTRHDEMAEVYNSGGAWVRIDSTYHIKANFIMSDDEKKNLLDIMFSDLVEFQVDWNVLK